MIEHAFGGALPHNPSGHAHNGTVIGHRPHHDGPGPDLDVVSEPNASEDLGAGPDHNIIAERRMAFPLFVTRAPECDALVKQDVVADLGGFADHHAHPVIDEKPSSDGGSGMNFNGRREQEVIDAIFYAVFITLQKMDDADTFL